MCVVRKYVLVDNHCVLCVQVESVDVSVNLEAVPFPRRWPCLPRTRRKRLIDLSSQAYVKSLVEDCNMISLARLGSSYVLRVFLLKRRLYEHIFPTDEGRDSATLNKALRIICDLAYEELRPLILQDSGLYKLLYLTELLKTETLNDEVPKRSAAGAAFAPPAMRAVTES